MSGQSLFRSALLNPDAAIPPGLTSWNGSDPAQRFAVYRNNVTVSLIEALAAAFPTVRAMVGEDFFRDLARAFLRAEPPASPILLRFGEGFPAYLATCTPVSTLPYLADLARLEVAQRRAFHAADAQPVPPSAFAALEQGKLADLRLILHPSLTAIASPFAVHSLWAAHQGALAIETVDPNEPEEVLVLRQGYAVLTFHLPPGGAVFFTALQAGNPLGEAARMGAATPGFDLAPCMSTLVTQGAAISLVHGD